MISPFADNVSIWGEEERKAEKRRREGVIEAVIT